MLEDGHKEQFTALLGATASQRTEKASCIVDFMACRNEVDQVALMQLILEKYGTPEVETGVRLTGRKMHDHRYKELNGILEDLVSGTIKLIIHTRMSLPVAAKTLRDLVFSLEDTEQRDYCVASIMADKAVPYRPIPQSTLQDFSAARLKALAREHPEQTYQLLCIHRAGLGTTREAELILKVLGTMTSEEDRIGMMEFVLRMYREEVVKASAVLEG